MIIYVDIDDTICYFEDNKHLNYEIAIPYKERITKINNLFDNGNVVVYWTARGSLSGINWFNITYKQLIAWGCKFNELRMGKPAYDLFIDDKNINADVFFTTRL